MRRINLLLSDWKELLRHVFLRRASAQALPCKAQWSKEMTKRKEPESPELSDQQIEELLPFYVNGTLSERELDLVERRIEQNPEFQNEVLYLNRLRDNIQNQVMENSPGEIGLKRLQKEIANKSVTNHTDRVTGKRPVNDNRRSLWWKPLALCASIALAILLPFNVVTYFSQEQDFTVAGSQNSIETPVLQVIFRAEATEGEIRKTLREFNLSIVDGPSALGLYRIRLAKDVTNQQLANILTSLKSRNFIEDVREE